MPSVTGRYYQFVIIKLRKDQDILSLTTPCVRISCLFLSITYIWACGAILEVRECNRLATSTMLSRSSTKRLYPFSKIQKVIIWSSLQVPTSPRLSLNYCPRWLYLNQRTVRNLKIGFRDWNYVFGIAENTLKRCKVHLTIWVDWVIHYILNNPHMFAIRSSMYYNIQSSLILIEIIMVLLYIVNLIRQLTVPDRIIIMIIQSGTVNCHIIKDAIFLYEISNNNMM